jgi:hypothetical protein
MNYNFFDFLFEMILIYLEEFMKATEYENFLDFFTTKQLRFIEKVLINYDREAF